MKSVKVCVPGCVTASTLVHCKGGLGRAGTIATRLLIELGVAPREAINAVRQARPGTIETIEQERYVLGLKEASEAVPGPSPAATKDRVIGALLGLAVGDAIGTALEFTTRDSYRPLTDVVGGGPFRLKPGQWTDDTAMALALADSLAENDGLDEADLMRRFVRWHEHGDYSCTGDLLRHRHYDPSGIGSLEENWEPDRRIDHSTGGWKL